MPLLRQWAKRAWILSKLEVWNYEGPALTTINVILERV